MSGASELDERLRKRYTAEVVPPCRVCGRELTIQRTGGGESTVYGCDSWEDDPENPGRSRITPGRRIADDHYAKSRWTQYRPGDTDVLAVLDELSRLSTLEASRRAK